MSQNQPTLAGRDAFISYSSRDNEFVTALRLAFEANGRQVWQDVKELELTEEWWAQIKAGIATADNYVFVVSPRSLASPVCHLEFEYARSLNKRVILVRYEPADEATSTQAMFERLKTQEYLQVIAAGRDMAAIANDNWRAVDAEQNITITSKEEIPAKVLRIIEAFDKDLLYIRQSNLLLGRAREWTDSGRNPSFLLTGSALTAAEAWRDAGKTPPPTQDHLDYITASRRAEDQRRRSTIILAFTGIFALVAIVGLLLAARQLSIEADAAVNQAATATVAQGAALIEQNRAIAAQQTAEAAADEARSAADEAQSAAATAQAAEEEALDAQGTAIALALDARLAEADSQLAQGNLLYQRLLAGSDIRPAEEALQRALTIYEILGDEDGQARTWLAKGNVALNRSGDLAAARDAFETALSFFRESGDREREAFSLRSLGEIEVREGNLSAARDHYEAALPIFREVGEQLGEAETLFSLGELSRLVDDFDAARETLESALTLFESLGDTQGQANTLRSLGEMAARQLDLPRAREALEDALPLFRELDDPLGTANTLYSLGELSLQEEDADAARENFEAALSQFREIGETLGEANALLGLAETSRLAGEYAAAGDYQDQAEALYRQMDILVGQMNVLISRILLLAAQEDVDGACATIDALFELVEGTDYENHPVVEMQRQNDVAFCTDTP